MGEIEMVLEHGQGMHKQHCAGCPCCETGIYNGYPDAVPVCTLRVGRRFTFAHSGESGKVLGHSRGGTTVFLDARQRDIIILNKLTGEKEKVGVSKRSAVREIANSTAVIPNPGKGGQESDFAQAELFSPPPTRPPNNHSHSGASIFCVHSRTDSKLCAPLDNLKEVD